MNKKSEKTEIAKKAEAQTPQRPLQGPVNIAPLDQLKGVYSNVAIIAHSKNEFVLDFIFDLAGQGNLVARVITNPEHIKKLHAVLGKNIETYEGKFGKIKVAE